MKFPSFWLFLEALFDYRQLVQMTLPERDHHLANVFVGRHIDLGLLLRSVNLFIWLQRLLKLPNSCGLIAHQRALLLARHGHRAQVEYGFIPNAPPTGGHCRLIINGSPLSPNPNFFHLRTVSAVIELEDWWEHIRDHQFDEARTLASKWDWDFEGETLLGELRFQGVAALCGRQATEHDLGLPPTWRQHLIDHHTRALLRESAHEELIIEIKHLFAQQSIDCLILKGSGHLREFYKAGERDSRDVDLLVRSAHMSAAAAVLIDMGFEPRTGHQRTWRRKGLEVDLHGKVSDLIGAIDMSDQQMPVNWNVDDLFERSPDGLLDPIDAFLLGGAHWLIRHGACGWMWAEDLRRQFSTLEISTLRQRAVDLGLDKIFNIVLKGLDNPEQLKPARTNRQRQQQNWSLFNDRRTRTQLVKRTFWPSKEYLENHHPGKHSLLRHWRSVVLANETP